MSNPTKFAYPLIIARAASLNVSKKQLFTKPAVIKQDFAIRNTASALGYQLQIMTLIKRSQAKFDPASDKLFLKVLANCANGVDIILVDDFLRLIDFNDLGCAQSQGAYLQSEAAPLFSIAHASFVKDINETFLRAVIKDRVTTSAMRSTTIKRGLKETANRYGATKPTRKAIDNAGKAKSLVADKKAQALQAEIEQIRLSLPLESRSNNKALADALNAAGVATPSGRGQWQGISVKRILDRIERMDDAALK